MFALLVKCLNCRMQVWLQCMDPAVLKPRLRRYDVAIMWAVRTATGQNFHARSLAYKRLRWPRRLMGGMVRSAVDVSVAAYAGGRCLCVPLFTTSVDTHGVESVGILDHMKSVFGNGVFDSGKETSRFQLLLDIGCKLGQNLHKYVMKMKYDMHGDEAWDTLPADSPFANGPAGAGVVSNKVSRHPQRDFTEWLEIQRARKVLNALLLQTKTRNRGVRLGRDEAAYVSCNVGSCQFVGVPAMPSTRMDNVMYRECWSHYLGGPSPVCAPHVGHRFSFAKGKRSSTVDIYEDNVVSACIPGDR